MDFCNACNNLITVRTDTGKAVGYCERCNLTQDAGGINTMIYFEGQSDGMDVCNIDATLALIPYDPVGAIVDRPCPKCGRKYLYQAILCNIIYFACKCGYQIKGSEAKI